MPAQKHNHIYKRTVLKDSVVYRCMKPDCTHYLRDVFIEGRAAECPECHEVFVLTKHLLHQRVMPTCPNCRIKNAKVKKTPHKDKTDALLSRLFSEGGRDESVS